MAQGALEDAPALREIGGVLVSLPSFQVRYVFVTTAEIFRDFRAERRQLPIATQQLSVYAVHVRVADLESRGKIEALLRAVGASAANPGYAFVGIESYGYLRYYPIRLSSDE